MDDKLVGFGNNKYYQYFNDYWKLSYASHMTMMTSRYCEFIMKIHVSTQGLPDNLHKQVLK